MKIDQVYFEDGAVGNALRRELTTERYDISEKDLRELKIDINGYESSKNVLEKLGCLDIPTVPKMGIDLFRKAMYAQRHEYDRLRRFVEEMR